MSHNLILRSQDQEFPLIQTPTDVTRAALSTGSVAIVAANYEHFLRSHQISSQMTDDDDYVGSRYRHTRTRLPVCNGCEREARARTHARRVHADGHGTP